MTGYFEQFKQMVGAGSGGAQTTYDLTGGRRRRRGTRSHKKSARRGGSAVSTAALPFGLLAVQKLFQTRKGRKGLKKMNKSVRRNARRVRRAI
jgi:hypothetical protein